MDPPKVTTKALRNALANAFPSGKALKMMVDLELEGELDVGTVFWDDDVYTVAYELITVAKNQRRYKRLIEGACEANPRNPRLGPICTQLAEWLASPDETDADILAAVAGAHARLQATTPTPASAAPDGDAQDETTPEPLNWTDIISFDLHDQEAYVKKRLEEELTGAVAFAIGGPEDLLNRYIVKRFEQVIQGHKRTYKPRKARITVHGLSAAADGRTLLEAAIVNGCMCARIQDLFDGSHVDVFLVILNYHIPAADLAVMAADVWTSISAEVADAVDGNHRRLVALLVDVGSDPSQPFPAVAPITAVPKVEPFNVTPLIGHFENHLTRAGVPKDRVDAYLKELRGLGGDVAGSISLMWDKVETVKQETKP